MITLLINLLIILVLAYIAHLIISAMGFPQLWKQIAYAIVGLIILIYLLRYLL